MSDTPQLELATPENVVLTLRPAAMGDRLGAFLLDLGVLLGGLVVLVILAVVAFQGPIRSSTGVLAAVLLLVSFVARSFYFSLAEIRWQGRTLGKRKLGLRVIARDGGPLTAEQVFARNLTREVETFLPVSILLAAGQLMPDAPWWVRAAAVLWALVMTAIPWMNQDRARLGDLVAGTVVIAEPRAELLEDLADASMARGRTSWTFTPEQLDVYGIHELQVLEQVLRREPSLDRNLLLQEIADKIQAKIGWQPPVPPGLTEAFLKSFYAAQRGRLEHKMLLGVRRERKVR